MVYILLLISSTMFATIRTGRWGIGGEIGNIGALSANYYISDELSVEGFASLNQGDWYLLGGGYHRHFWGAFGWDENLAISYGGRGYLLYLESPKTPFLTDKLENKKKLGLIAAGLAGAQYFGDELPFEFYTHIGIGISFLPRIEIMPIATIGVRVFF